MQKCDLLHLCFEGMKEGNASQLTVISFVYSVEQPNDRWCVAVREQICLGAVQ